MDKDRCAQLFPGREQMVAPWAPPLGRVGILSRDKLNYLLTSPEADVHLGLDLALAAIPTEREQGPERRRRPMLWRSQHRDDGRIILLRRARLEEAGP